MSWLGPRVLEQGTKFEHVMRLHEGGKRGCEMEYAKVVDWDAVHNTARVQSYWQPTSAVYEDSVRLCFRTGMVAEFVPLGLATDVNVEGFRLDAIKAGHEADFRPRWLVFAARLPGAEDGVLSQSKCSVKFATTDPDDAKLETLPGLRKFVGGYVLRPDLPAVRVHHRLQLQGLHLVLRDAVPDHYGCVRI